MWPQDAGFTNIARINALTQTINNIDTCAALQALATELFLELENEIINAENQSALLKLLLSIPHDLASAINWIINFINQITGPYVKLIEQVEATIVAYAQLVAAIAAAAAKIEQCVVQSPQIVLTAAVNTL